MNNKAWIWILVIVILVIGGIMLFGNNASDTELENTTEDMTADLSDDMIESTSTPSTTATSTGTTTSGSQSGAAASVGASAGAAATVGAVKTFTVTGQNYTFSPTTLSVNKGDKVRITFKNASGVHDLKVDGYNVGTPVVQSGQSATFEFTADKSGSFEYYCSVGNHRAMGMKGTLMVK